MDIEDDDEGMLDQYSGIGQSNESISSKFFNTVESDQLQQIEEITNNPGPPDSLKLVNNSC